MSLSAGGQLLNFDNKSVQYFFRCDEVFDCPLTETSNGGEDEEGCEESSGDFEISDIDLRMAPNSSVYN